jgi:membrane-bound ClpP family serine protease
LSKKIRMPGSARAGLALLFVGAIFVGVGTYLNRGALSLYGLIMVIGGFSLYMISSVVVTRKRSRRKNTYQ